MKWVPKSPYRYQNNIFVYALVTMDIRIKPRVESGYFVASLECINYLGRALLSLIINSCTKKNEGTYVYSKPGSTTTWNATLVTVVCKRESTWRMILNCRYHL